MRVHVCVMRVCLCVALTPCIKPPLEAAEAQRTQTHCVFGCVPLLVWHNDDVPVQRAAASVLPGLVASSCGSVGSADPVAPLGLPRRGPAETEPACRLHTEDLLLYKSRGR